MYIYICTGSGRDQLAPARPERLLSVPRYHVMPAADVVSYSSVVSAMARAARWPEALAVLQHMEHGADEAMWCWFRDCGMVIGILKPTEMWSQPSPIWYTGYTMQYDWMYHL